MSAETQLTSADTLVDVVEGGPRTLLVVYTDSPGGSHSEVIELPDGASITFGRSRSASVRIDSGSISRVHAKIERRGDELSVEDLASRNGTRVNGALISGPTPLQSGDEVVIGPATIIASVASRPEPDRDVGSCTDLEDRLVIELDRTRRYRRPCALVLISGELETLDAIAPSLGAQLRPMDLLAEYSPSVLALVLPELDAAKASAVAEKLTSAAPVSLGVASAPAHGLSFAELIARAHEALAPGAPSMPASIPPKPQVPRGAVVINHQMRRVYELARKVAGHPITVLVRGETGAGKELVAGVIHQASERRGRFVRINCASLPETLLESQLFGHEKGAFTGATHQHIGLFEAADAGTLFLDEIGEMSLATQAKLLRVLEVRRFTRVGGTTELSCDVRVVCATHRDLEADVAAGQFRQDLFFRVSGFTIVVPPLRDRPDEIEPLAEHFLRLAVPNDTPALSPEARVALRGHRWPGNVRELRNAIERAVVLHVGGVIEVDDLPERIRQVRVHSPTLNESLVIDGERDIRDHIADLERTAIVAALEACHGNQTQAAKKLGISRRALIYRLERHGLKPKPGVK